MAPAECLSATRKIPADFILSGFFSLRSLNHSPAEDAFRKQPAEATNGSLDMMRACEKCLENSWN
jgi:hypothetical protein